MPSLQQNSDRVIVIGGGIAGLATALSLAPLRTTLIAKAPLGAEASTPLAQGGIAAAMGRNDAPAPHAADTLAAGAGLCDPAVAKRIAEAAPSCLADLAAWGMAFDRAATGELALGLEAAHSRRRIVHAGGDSTGRRVIEALGRAARTGSRAIPCSKRWPTRAGSRRTSRVEKRQRPEHPFRCLSSRQQPSTTPAARESAT